MADVENNETANEPTDIAQAFQYLRDQDKGVAQEPVGDGLPNGGDAQAGAEIPSGGRSPEEPGVADATGVPEGVPGTTGATASEDRGASAEQPVPDISGSPTGGSATPAPAPTPNLSDQRKQIINQINQQAAAEANKVFKEQNIRKFNIGDLYSRDTNTGQITFNNPDDPRRPFTSRTEAEQWINSMNNQIDQQWRTIAQEQQRKLLDEAKPYMELIEFIPRWNSMDPQMQQVFDSLVSPYAIERDGQVVGFACDLNAAERQARNITNMFAKQQQQTASAPAEQQPKPSSGPALDTKTGSAAGAGDNEPKNLAEAMKMYQQQQRQKGKK